MVAPKYPKPTVKADLNMISGSELRQMKKERNRNNFINFLLGLWPWS